MDSEPVPMRAKTQAEDDVSCQQTVAAANNSKSVNGILSTGAFSEYQYSPLLSATSIRIVELLPGTDEDVFQVSLDHKMLTDLPEYEALSYEWGEPVGTHPIYCGDKILKVTSNLLAALKRIRRPQEARLMWIDAICINQADLDERSQQVAIMRDIYQKAARVVLWLGEEINYTKDAVEIIPVLASLYDSLPSAENAEPLREDVCPINNPSEIECGDDLLALTQTPEWRGILDLMTERTYFVRLWVLQEIVMASKVAVQCGSYEIDWDLFSSAAKLLQVCQFLQTHISDLRVLGRIWFINLTKKRLQCGHESLFNAVSAAFLAKATDPKDYIFGTIGMAKGKRHAEVKQIDFAKQIDYNKSVGRVFTDATKWIILDMQDLDICFRYNNSISHARPHSEGPDSLVQEDMPSWAANFAGDGATFTISSAVHWCWPRDAGKCPEEISFDDHTMLVQGIRLDTVSEVSDNFTGQNIKSQVLEACQNLPSNREAYLTIGDARKALWKALLVDSEGNTEEDFESLFSWWLLESMNLPSVAQDCLFQIIMSSSRPDIQSELLEPANRERIMEWIPEKAAKGKLHLSRVEAALCQPSSKMGRNLFKTGKGYIGVGPGGTYGGDPAVQVGDLVAFLVGSQRPIVLRKREDGCFTMVGPAYIGSFGGNIGVEKEDLRTFSIR
jgi:hypothetical protein